MPAAKGLGGPGDVGDAVHSGGGGAGGRGHKDGQVWHLRQVDDAWREKQEDCQDDTEPLQLGCAGTGSDAGEGRPVLLLWHSARGASAHMAPRS